MDPTIKPTPIEDDPEWNEPEEASSRDGESILLGEGSGIFRCRDCGRTLVLDQPPPAHKHRAPSKKLRFCGGKWERVIPAHVMLAAVEGLIDGGLTDRQIEFRLGMHAGTIRAIREVAAERHEKVTEEVVS